MSDISAEPACPVCSGPLSACECEFLAGMDQTIVAEFYYSAAPHPEVLAIAMVAGLEGEVYAVTEAAWPTYCQSYRDQWLLAAQRALANPRISMTATDDPQEGDMDASLYLAAKRRITALEAENVTLREKVTRLSLVEENLIGEQKLQGYLHASDMRNAELKAQLGDRRMVAADESHPYNGPTRPVTDADGKVTGREAVPDPVHERAHGVVGDILAGRLIKPARDQMEKALADARVKDGKAPAPFPVAPKSTDTRQIGR